MSCCWLSDVKPAEFRVDLLECGSSHRDKRLVKRVDDGGDAFLLGICSALPKGTAEGPGGYRLEVQNPSSSSALNTEVKRSINVYL